MLQQFEAKIEKELAKPEAITISQEDGERLYRLLGAYRGLSKTLVDCAADAHAIDWSSWRDERFSW